MKAFLIFLCFVTTLVAQEPMDVVHLKDGASRSGKILSVDDKFLRLEMPVAIPTQAPVVVALSREAIKAVDFSLSPAIHDVLERNKDADALPALWKRFQPFLALPGSPSPRIGNLYATALTHGSPQDLAHSLNISKAVETQSWDVDERQAGLAGRLRAIRLMGRPSEVSEEASRLQEHTHSDVRSEATLILAHDATKKLHRLLDDNPRWQEDIQIRAKRHLLYHEAVEWNLRPAVLFGAGTEAAASGLWNALQLLHAGGDSREAATLAQDLVVLYPHSKEAALAADWLTRLPSDVLSIDDENPL